MRKPPTQPADDEKENDHGEQEKPPKQEKQQPRGPVEEPEIAEVTKDFFSESYLPTDAAQQTEMDAIIEQIENIAGPVHDSDAESDTESDEDDEREPDKVDWPKQNREEPLNEFDTEGLITSCHPSDPQTD